MNQLRLPGPLVSSEWLSENLNHPKLIVLDATIIKPAVAANTNVAIDETNQISGTQFFDIENRFSDLNCSLPHMMPTSEIFSKEVQVLGVCQDSVVVIYDRHGIFSSPRAWWMFKAMGHTQVAVLDGGLPAWISLGLPVQRKAAMPVQQGNFSARPNKELFCNADLVNAALQDDNWVVLDARSEGRFYGREPEPRAGLRPGHMPNSLSLPFTSLLNGFHLKDPESLRRIFAGKKIDHQNLILTCGSGVSACVLALAGELAGFSKLRVYDGSWSEWGLPSLRPVVES